MKADYRREARGRRNATPNDPDDAYGKGNGNGRGQRQRIAAQAARLMAEDGVTDHGQAKRKAVHQLGLSDNVSLPDNAEVDLQLRSYLELFQPDELRERMASMRKAAASLMPLLEDFRPYLTGAVLDGTAVRHSAIELDLFPDSTKEVEIFLINRDIAFDILPPPAKHARNDSVENPEDILLLDWEEYSFRIKLFPPSAEHRVSPRSDPARRIRLPALLSLIAENPSKNAP